MRFVSTALVMMAIALMLLALMLLTPTVRANPMTFVANLAGHVSQTTEIENLVVFNAGDVLHDSFADTRDT
jgi:hypothetical protein